MQDPTTSTEGSQRLVPSPEESPNPCLERSDGDVRVGMLPPLPHRPLVIPEKIGTVKSCGREGPGVSVSLSLSLPRMDRDEGRGDRRRLSTQASPE